jgi:thiol-disulfide isomerase/thioredoxin
MTDTNGEVHTNASLKGKVVLVDFWATWCGPCKAASPTMQKLHEKYASKGLVVIGANTYEQAKDRATAAAKYKKDHKYTYVFTKENDKLASALGARGIPFFVFIDKQGVVREVATGFGEGESPAKFEKIIQSLLK